jgi:hypothetical protein
MEKTIINDLKDLVASIRLKLSKHKFMEAKLKDGTIVQYEGELNVGTALNVIDAGGQVSPAPNGSHELEDGTIVTVSEGIVSEVIKPEVEVEIEAEKPVLMAEVEAKIAEALSAHKNENKQLLAKLSEQAELVKDMFEVVEKLAAEPQGEVEKPAKTSFAKQKVDGRMSAIERMRLAGEKFNEKYKN